MNVDPDQLPNATDEKDLYEQLDSLSVDDALVGTDTLAEVLLALTGMSVHNGQAVLDPSVRDDATRVAKRWLRDRGYLPRTRRETRIRR